MGKSLVNAVGIECRGPKGDRRESVGALLKVFSDASVNVSCPHHYIDTDHWNRKCCGIDNNEYQECPYAKN